MGKSILVRKGATGKGDTSDEDEHCQREGAEITGGTPGQEAGDTVSA